MQVLLIENAEIFVHLFRGWRVRLFLHQGADENLSSATLILIFEACVPALIHPLTTGHRACVIEWILLLLEQLSIDDVLSLRLRLIRLCALERHTGLSQVLPTELDDRWREKLLVTSVIHGLVGLGLCRLPNLISSDNLRFFIRLIVGLSWKT